MNITLSATDYAAISPLLILLAGALIVLLLESFCEITSRSWSFLVTLLTIGVALYATLVAPASQNTLLTPWLRFDHLARTFTLLFLAIGFGSTLLSAAFFKRFDATHGEYYFFLLSCLFGLILIGASADFLTLFLGMETLSIALYVMCGYMKGWEISHEAAIKYFLMGALAAAFLVYGIALIYGAVGTTSFNQLLAGYKGIQTASQHTLFMGGIALVTLGLAFKAAIVPFHVWAPDVYEGAPTPVTAFMAVGTKAGAFAAFVRVFFDGLPHFDATWNEAISFLAYPTLIYANIVALRQTQLRRFFAYSGISHAGFLLIPIAAGVSHDSLSSLLFYLVVYALATLGSFAVIAYLDERSRGVLITDLKGLFKRSPWLAGALTLCLLTLAGIPPTAGFFAKFYLFKVAFEAGFYPLVVVGLLTTILSAFYYMRIVAVMYSESPVQAAAPSRLPPAAVVGIVTTAVLILVSCFPTPLLTKLL